MDAGTGGKGTGGAGMDAGTGGKGTGGMGMGGKMDGGPDTSTDTPVDGGGATFTRCSRSSPTRARRRRRAARPATMVSTPLTAAWAPDCRTV